MFYKSVQVAAFGVMALGIAALSGSANAQTPINVSLDTNSAITVVDGADFDFGEWFLVHDGADDFELNMTGAGVLTVANIATSVATELTSVDQPADLTVETPAAAVVQMTRGVITDFGDAALTLAAITYTTATEGPDDPLPQAVASPVTVVAGATPETVSFGADIQVTGTPADGNHTANFTVSFAY